MILTTHLFPANTALARAVGGVQNPQGYVQADAQFIASGATSAWLSAGAAGFSELFPPAASGDVVGRPLAIECVSGRLFSGELHVSDFECGLLHVNPSDISAIPPADAISGEGTGWRAGVTTVTPPIYIGIGVTAYPVYDDGHSPRVVHYVPRPTTDVAFPEYTDGYLYGWKNSLAGSPFAARYPGLSIDGYSDLGYSNWGFAVGFNNAGVVDVGSFQPLPAHIVFGIDLTWNLAQKVAATEFIVEVAANAVARLEELSSRKIVGFEWYGHGYWSGAAVKPYTVKLGTTTGRSLTPANVTGEIPRLPFDYSGLFRTPLNSGITLRSAKLGNLVADSFSDTILMRSPSRFKSARGAYITYLEV